MIHIPKRNIVDEVFETPIEYDKEPDKDTDEYTTNVIREIKRLKLNRLEIRRVLKNLKTTKPRQYTPLKINTKRNNMKFGVISDLHLGHENFREDILDHAVQTFKDENIDFIVNAGDTIEGMSGRYGHIYELSHIGYTAQMDYAEKQFEKLSDWDVYSIEANTSHSGWYKSKANTGVDIGVELERRIGPYKFLGYDEQDIIINGIRIRVAHPGGGTSYAICFDDKTEVLTENGWKLFKDLDEDEKVATLDKDTMMFEWQMPTDYIEQEYDGELLHFTARSYDLMVTPNHKLFVRRYPKLIYRKEKLSMPQKSHKTVDTDWKLVEAKEIADSHGFIRQKWQMIRNSHAFRHTDDNEDTDWLILYAWYITEGCCHKSGKQIVITQSKEVNPENWDEIASVLERLGIKYGVYGKKQKHFTISNKELATKFKSMFGRISSEKMVPKHIKNLPKEKLEIFLKTLIKGDGWENGKSWGYKSISKRLLDDIQEIAIKCGYGATIGNNNDIFISKIQNYPTINKRPERVPYNGKIYCVEVPNHIILVRRNGKAVWSGNSYKLQKYVNSLGGGDKPHIIIEGHFHKACYMFYRNIHCIDAGCFDGATKVITKDGKKQIRKIKIGDEVLTHKNRFRKVTELFKRKHYKKWYKFTYGRGSDERETITCTEEHPILVYRNGEKKWVIARNVLESDWVFVLSKKCKRCDKRIPYWRVTCKNCLNKYRTSKQKNNDSWVSKSKGGSKHYKEDILPRALELKKEGYKVIPIGDIVPDIVASKDGKLIAIEVENEYISHGKGNKYKDFNFPDEVRWEIINKGKEDWDDDFIEDESGFVRVPIKKKEIVKKRNKLVYNIEVEDDNSYVASNVVVHNCLQNQTIFMKKKRTPAHVGYWIIDLDFTKQGIEKFKPTFIPFYD